MKDKTCAIPWKSLYIHSDGSVFPCCIVFKKLGNFNELKLENAWNHPTMLEIRKSHAQGLEYPGCKSCWNREDKGLSSRRNSFQLDLKEAGLTTHFETSSHASLEDIVHFDISFGNQCNLNCAFCSPDKSSKWEQLVNDLPSESTFDFYRDRAKNISSINSQRLIDSILMLPSLSILEIKGGEPFFAKAHQSLLEKLISANRAKNISLWYSSNLTILPEYLFELLPHFKSVHISISLDGVGEVQEKIRGKKASFDDVILPNVNKIRMLPNLSLSTHTTVCAYNFIHLESMLEYLHSSKVSLRSNAFGLVRKPAFLSPFALSQHSVKSKLLEFKNSSFKKLRKFAQNINLEDFSEETDPEFLSFNQYWSSVN